MLAVQNPSEVSMNSTLRPSNIDLAIRIAGGGAAVGKSLGRARESVWYWKKRDSVPEDMRRELAALTFGLITVAQLSPPYAPINQGATLTVAGVKNNVSQPKVST